MLEPIQQRGVPGDGLAEAFVGIGLQTHGAAIEDLEGNARFGRDQAQQRRLILDRMGDEIGDAHGPLLLGVHGFSAPDGAISSSSREARSRLAATE